MSGFIYSYKSLLSLSLTCRVGDTVLSGDSWDVLLPSQQQGCWSPAPEPQTCRLTPTPPPRTSSGGRSKPNTCRLRRSDQHTVVWGIRTMLCQPHRANGLHCRCVMPWCKPAALPRETAALPAFLWNILTRLVGIPEKWSTIAGLVRFDNEFPDPKSP